MHGFELNVWELVCSMQTFYLLVLIKNLYLFNLHFYVLDKDMAGAFMDPSSGIMYHPGSMDYMRDGDRQQHLTYHANSNGMFFTKRRYSFTN